MSADRRLFPKNFSVVNNLPKKTIRDSLVFGEQVLGGVGSGSGLDGSDQGSILEVGWRRRIRTLTDGARGRSPAIRRAAN